MAGKYNDSKVNEDEAFFLSRNDLINRWGNIVSSWLFLPGLVGLWPMSSVQRSTGNAYDISGQARTLTYNGNPTYNIYNNFLPYIDLDGAGDYLSRADETDLDVQGTETINAVAVRGLTYGGWFWFDTVAGAAGLIAKQNGGLSYVLQRSGATVLNNVDNGAGGAVASPAIAVAISGWYFVVGRWIPSTSVDIYANGTLASTVAGVPASLRNLAGNLAIGMQVAPATNPLDGRATLCFLSHQAYSVALLNAMYHQSRILFGV